MTLTKEKLIEYGLELTEEYGDGYVIEQRSAVEIDYAAGFTEAVEFLWPVVEAAINRKELPTGYSEILVLDAALSDLEKKLGEK